MQPPHRELVVSLMVTVCWAASSRPVRAQDDDPKSRHRRTAPAAASLRLETLTRQGTRYLADLEDGGRAELTLSPRLQEAAEDVFRAFEVPYGAAVVVSIADGRVLALAGRAAAARDLGPEELALRPWAPAASVFKIVSAAALVSAGGIRATTKTCYHGGLSAVMPDNLIDVPRLDRRCDTLAYGLGKSQNAILAKLASRHLTVEALEQAGAAFGFGRAIPFDLPVEPSELDVPREPLEFARTAAGFWHSTLSPLHGALMAAAIANDGKMPAPRLVARAWTADGRRTPSTDTPAPSRRVVDARTAREVGRMMELTTTMGTAKATFRDRGGRRYLPVEVAGKTGSLARKGDAGYLGYSWFVGYAPAARPQIAFAVALGNPDAWKIKAAYVARRLVAEYLADGGDRSAARLLAAR